MELCSECKRGFCQSKVRRFYKGLAGGFCSPKCQAASQATILADDKTEILAERICMKLMNSGYIDDYDCDAVDLVKNEIENG
jgi:hydrogenase maturation factor HypF (carbamoyltransferase family)